MALEGNGSINFALDGQSDCSKIPATSSFGYQAFCWPSGIGMGSFSSNANMNLNSSTTELAAPELHPLGSINTSYCLDDLFAFPVHNNIDGGTHGTVGLLGDPLQVVGNVKVESQHLVPNAMGIKNAGHRFDQSRSSAEEPTSSESTGESQSLKKRKSLSTDSRLLKPVASPGEKEDDCKVKQKKTSELPLNKGDSKPETKPGANGAKTEANSKQTQEKNKASEPPKDYIHVRARRGQATDSHSLAERVRREKISERMKLLQDLVPGCNKITGKAMMLDEIINYVQSLQRQVEFLSMKLEAVNPRMELNAGQILPKDILEPSTIGYATDPIMAHPQFSQPEWSAAPVGSSYGMGQQFMANAGEVSVKKTMNDKFSLMNSFGDAKNPNTWDDEIQNAVRAGVGANLTPSFATRNFHGLFPTTHSNIQP